MITQVNNIGASVALDKSKKAKPRMDMDLDRVKVPRGVSFTGDLGTEGAEAAKKFLPRLFEIAKDFVLKKVPTFVTKTVPKFFTETVAPKAKKVIDTVIELVKKLLPKAKDAAQEVVENV